MGLAQTGVAVDEQRIVIFTRMLGHGPGRGVGQLVAGAHHIGFKGEGVRIDQRAGMIGRNAVIGGQLLVIQNLHLQIGGKDLTQRLLDIIHEARFNGTLFKRVVAVQHESGILHGHHGNLVKERANTDLG